MWETKREIVEVFDLKLLETNDTKKVPKWVFTFMMENITLLHELQRVNKPFLVRYPDTHVAAYNAEEFANKSVEIPDARRELAARKELK